GLPQIRTCRFPASGSSSTVLLRTVDAVDDRGRQKREALQHGSVALPVERWAQNLEIDVAAELAGDDQGRERGLLLLEYIHRVLNWLYYLTM
ncbi:MAG: hypothetical protein ABIY55_22980, partial [Kofleriaceae bacterium]